MNLCICGAAGRMGKRLIACAQKFENLKITGAVDAPTCPLIGKDSGVIAGIGENGILISADLTSECKKSEVVIDFALADKIVDRINVYETLKLPVVFGTTAVDASGSAAIKKASASIPIIHAPNFSVGVNLLFSLVNSAAKILDENYDVEIIEMHHKHKKDAPSGTAVRLAEQVEEARNLIKEEKRIYGRKGITGERPTGEIAVHSLRGGDVVGDHTVVFATDGERIELTHKASNRDAFAKGALRAAEFLYNKPPGIYTMNDILGLK